MMTQVLGGYRRSGAISGIGAVALTLAGSLLMLQANSIWSSWGSTQLELAPVRTARSSSTYTAGSQLPDGCWVKYGCDGRQTAQGTRPAGRGWLPDGCVVKFGCQFEPAGRKGSTKAVPERQQAREWRGYRLAR